VKKQVQNSSWKITQTSANGVEKRGEPPYEYWGGAVATPHGYVEVFSQKDWTALNFAHQGRMHRRSIRREYTKRGLAILAGRFAKEIVEVGA
jgi:hypothetical protein